MFCRFLDYVNCESVYEIEYWSEQIIKLKKKPLKKWRKNQMKNPVFFFKTQQNRIQAYWTLHDYKVIFRFCIIENVWLGSIAETKRCKEPSTRSHVVFILIYLKLCLKHKRFVTFQKSIAFQWCHISQWFFLRLIHRIKKEATEKCVQIVVTINFKISTILCVESTSKTSAT